MSNDIPSTLNGPPICSLVPPGKCQFGKDPIAVPLKSRTKVSPTSAVLRFGLPDESQPLNLSTCACILAKATIDGEDIVRPYTPISTNDHVGYFDLLIKDYGPDAHMSHEMHEIDVDDNMKFIHTDQNVKIQAPFDYNHILILVGGTGITPMIQALHAVLGHKSKEKPKVTMLYGSKVKDDILGKELLHKWANEHKDQFTLVDVLSDEPDDSSWSGRRGYIDKKLIQEFEAGPEMAKSIVFVCGPPPMYDALCGPRDEKDKVTGVLGELGYTADQLYKF